MFVCQWHLTAVFGKQKQALDIVTNWAKEGFAQPGVVKPESMRFLVGHLGPSPSHIICEYVFKDLAEFVQSHKAMTGDNLRHYAQSLESLIAPGSQHWEILRIVE